MNVNTKIPTKSIIREMYSSGWISFDLFVNGGVSFELILMFTNRVQIIQQDPTINFDIHFYNDIRIDTQIDAYNDLIRETEWVVDYFTEPILDGYKDQLAILKDLKLIIQTQLN
jgi:hypothetical protein